MQHLCTVDLTVYPNPHQDQNLFEIEKEIVREVAIGG